jgi:hypothetical protein
MVVPPTAQYGGCDRRNAFVRWGLRYSDSVVVCGGGIEVLTSTPRTLEERFPGPSSWS